MADGGFLLRQEKDKDKSEKKEKKKKEGKTLREADDDAQEEVEPEEEPSRSQSRGGRTLTREEADKKGKSIQQEYFHLKDINEAVACVKELNVFKGMGGGMDHVSIWSIFVVGQ